MKANSALPQVILIVLITTLGMIILQHLPKPKEEQAGLNHHTSSTENTALNTKGYTFYDVLKSGEVVVTESHYTSTPKNTHLKHPTLLQIAATSSKESALSMTRRLKNAGLETVQVVERESSNGLLYLVRTKPYKTYDALKAGMAIAEKLNFHPDKIHIK